MFLRRTGISIIGRQSFRLLRRTLELQQQYPVNCFGIEKTHGLKLQGREGTRKRVQAGFEPALSGLNR